MTKKIKITVDGITLEIEEKNGKFVKPDVLKSLAGYGSALKPAFEPILISMKLCS